MNLRDAIGARLAGQLGHPHGAPARLMGTLLDKGNHSAIRAAVDALEPHGGEVVADVGFGGGLGLELLLERVEIGRAHV